MYDVIIVGGGHNGLTCAAYLARASRRVLVLEAQPTLGGYCATFEIPGAPGYLGSPYALDFLTTNIPPSVVDDLDLARFGLRWARPEAIISYLSPDGDSLTFWQDRARTVAEIARFSRRDAQRYDRMCDLLGDTFAITVPYLQGHPRRVTARTAGEMVRQAARARKGLAPAARLMASSVDQALEEWFERDELKATFASLCLFALVPLDEPGSAAGLSFLPVQHRYGIRRPVGGSGAFARALVDCVVAAGGEVRAATPVREIVVSAGRARGVVLDTGEEIAAGQVVAALDPTTLLSRLLDPTTLPEETQDELRGLQVLGRGVNLFTGNVAVTRRPRYPRRTAGDGALESVLLAPDLPTVRRASQAAMRGEIPSDFPLWIITPSTSDRALVPPGSEGDSLYVYPSPVPWRLEGNDWETEKDKHLDRCLDLLESYAPGTKESVIGTRVTSPADLAGSAHRGHWAHVDLVPSQLGPWRPIPSLAGYRTPILGLWHTGAGAHPVGSISGWSGRSTAREILRPRRDWRKRP